MKKILVGMMCAGFLFVAACGSSSSTPPNPAAEQEAEDSFDDFGTEMEACLGGLLNAQTLGVEKSESITCDCTGGSGTITGTISDDEQTITLVADQCETAEGRTYDGELSSTDGGTTINGNMDSFGECSSATATGIRTDEVCAGTVSVTCPAGTVTCTVVDGAEEDCDLNC